MRLKQNRFGVMAATVMLMLLMPVGGAAIAQPSALVIDQLGDASGAMSIMQTQGWTVTTASVFETLEDGYDLSQYDVIWIPAQTDFPSLHSLLSRGGRLNAFAKHGGVVAVMDVSPSPAWLDIAPGGIDAWALAEGGGGTVTIASPDHAVVTGAGIGGTALTAYDLDPSATGGLGCLTDAPEGSVVIAENSDGPVVVEYPFADGHVLVCALQEPTQACTHNLVLYIQSLVQ